MATFKFDERSTLEEALGMGSGYVLNFSDRTFREFIWDQVGRDINDGAYSRYGTSKAKHLRAFWEVESANVAAALTRALLHHGKERNLIEDQQYDAAMAVVARLGGGGVLDIDALKPNAQEPTFDRLARAVRESIDAGRPEEGLDRLHTFLIKYVRILAAKRGVATPRDKPLHSVFGEYIKRLRGDGILDSEMSLRIMKAAISSLEAFNDVRNEQSFAHDNEILRTHEALYIFNHIASLVRFLQVVEGTIPDTSLDELSAPAG